MRNNKNEKRPRLLGVVFDIDGVLFDSRDANIEYYNMLREGVGLAPMSALDEEYCHMASSIQAFERCIPPYLRKKAHSLLENFSYNDYLFPKIHLHTGLVEFLTWLQAWGVHMGIFTNRVSNVDILLRHFGVSHFFISIKTAGICPPKPAPDGLLKTMDEWGTEPKYIAFIGDSEVDSQAAEQAGVPFWAYRNKALKGQLHVDDYFSLMEIVKPLVER